MPPPSDLRLEFATSIFVRECLRQFMRLHPNTKPEDLPMKALCDYPKREQQALGKAIGMALEATTGMTDAYAEFLKQKLELTQAPKE